MIGRQEDRRTGAQEGMLKRGNEDNRWSGGQKDRRTGHVGQLIG